MTMHDEFLEWMENHTENDFDCPSPGTIWQAAYEQGRKAERKECLDVLLNCLDLVRASPDTDQINLILEVIRTIRAKE